jgi:hypothetical protein
VTFLCASKEKLPARQGGSSCFQARKQNKSNVHGLLAALAPSGPAFGRSARFALVPPSRE